MPLVKVSKLIAANKADLYALIKDMEGYPVYMKDLVSVRVLERGEHSTVTEWISNVDGRTIKWREQDIFDDQNMHITYRQIDGDLKRFEGEWLLNDSNSPNETEVVLTVDFEFGIPMIAGLLHPLLKRKVKENSENMLQALAEQIQSGING